MPATRPMGVLAAAAAACVLGGCGNTERQQVQAKVEQFAKAAVAKDYRTICDQVLAPALLARLAAGGIPCQEAMQIALGAVQHPTLSIGRISVAGRRASALTLTAAQGQPASVDALELVRTGSGWRISSLGSPVSAAGQRSR